MLRQFKNHIKKSRIFSLDDKILATVSGGVDSVVLCYLLKSCDANFEIAHCNFNLRGKDANDDETFVQKLAKSLNVNFHSITFDTKKHASENGMSTQMAARELRYDWFDKLKNENNFDLIATAHHKNDNVETVLLNLVRGTGHKGLKGISEKKNSIIRPLLPFSKDEILSFANENNIDWREDVSNQENKYKRNLMRNEIIPLLEKLNPNFINTFSENIEKFSLESDMLSTNHLENQKELLIDDLLKSKAPLLEVWKWIEQYDFKFNDAKDIFDSIESESGKEFLSQSHKIIKDRKSFVVAKIGKANDTEIIIDKYKKYTFDDVELDFSRVYMVNYGLGENVAFINSDKISLPLKIRKWREGDKFKPLGMKGSKLVSDFLIDEKVNVLDKEKQLVLECKDGIIWVIGRRISEDYKVFDEASALKIEFKK